MENLGLSAFRVSNRQLEHKTVQLGFRKREGPFIFDRVLGRQDDEGSGSGKVSPRASPVPPASPQQRRTGSWVKPVDLICQDNVGKDGTLAQFRSDSEPALKI